MKKYISIISLLVIIILLCSCEPYDPDLKTVDDLSRTVKDAMGDACYFRGLNISEDGKKHYCFTVNEISAESIGDMVSVFNDALSTQEEMVSLSVEFNISHGAYGVLIHMSNYSEGEDGIEMYDGMYYMYIVDQYNFTIVPCDPELYSEIKGIRELRVNRALQDKADQMGFDWHTYWPDLEKIDIYEG